MPLPAGPKGWQLLRLLRPWWPNWPLEMTALQRRYGDIVALIFGPRRVYLVSDPKLIQAILGLQEGLIKEHGMQVNRALFLGDGLLSSEGEAHKKGRQVARTAIDPSQFPGYSAIVLDCLKRGEAEWTDGQSLDIHAATFKLTMRIVSEAILGLDLDPYLPDLKRAIEEISAFSAQAVVNPFFRLYQHLPLPRPARFRAARDYINGLLDKAVTDARPGKGLLGHLKSHGPQAGVGLPQLRDIAKSVLLAGQETTANALAWTFYLLSKHPEVEARLLEEFRAHPLDGDGKTPPALPYARAVLREAMRLYPPVWTLGRELLQDLDLPGLALRRGDSVYMCQYVVQRDARWFPDPERFDPSRFEEGAPERPAFAYFPFGAGPRGCIGESFAMLEMGLTLRAWLPCWRFVLEAPEPIEMDAFIALKPKGGLRMRVEAR
jgi:cytochrome P450